MDADGPFAAVILLNADEETARRNVQLLRARISEGATWAGDQPYRDIIDSVEIIHDGRLVLALLRTDQVGLWLGLPILRETLLLHEERAECPHPQVRPGAPARAQMSRPAV